MSGLYRMRMVVSKQETTVVWNLEQVELIARRAYEAAKLGLNVRFEVSER